MRSTLVRSFAFEGLPAARLERVLAVGRALLTASALVAIYLDPTQASRLRVATNTVLLGYAAYSLVVLAAVHYASRLEPKHGLLLHGADILWASVLTFVSEGPVSPFFLFFMFAVVAAAYRWGFWETISTAIVILAIFLLEIVVTSIGPWSHTWFASVAFDLNRTILRVAYLLLTGFLLGYLAEQEKHTRRELAAIAEAARQPRVDLGVSGSVAAVANGLIHTFQAAAAIIVIEEHDTQQVRLWTIQGGQSGVPTAPAPVTIAAAQRTDWLFADHARAWHVTMSGGAAPVWRTTEPGAWRLKRRRGYLPGRLVANRPFTTLTAVNIGLEREWTGRIYLFDIVARRGLAGRLHFLESLTDHIVPGLTNVLLLRRQRSQASATERARVARELHDGTIQALFGIDMKLEALRRRARADMPTLPEDFDEIQHALQREVLSLRELMQALRPIELDTNAQLADVLAGVVERFRRDTAIPARFIADAGSLSLHPARALEFVRIVQEALVNVRKHSRASNVLVRLTRRANDWELTVDDDGCGFEFEGHITGAELEKRHIGPAIIRERARSARARLEVDSRPGLGARIELMFTEDTNG